MSTTVARVNQRDEPSRFSTARSGHAERSPRSRQRKSVGELFSQTFPRRAVTGKSREDLLHNARFSSSTPQVVPKTFTQINTSLTINNAKALALEITFRYGRSRGP